MALLQLAILILLIGSELALCYDFLREILTIPVEPPAGAGISLLVPFRTDGARRHKTWNWLKRYYRDSLPGAEIVQWGNNETPFCKTAAVNDAFNHSAGDIVVILDADCYIEASVLLEAADRIRAARAEGHKLWFIPYRLFYRLTEAASSAVLASDPANPLRYPVPPPPSVLASNKGSSNGHWFGALIQVMPREAFASVGGMDRRFHGWGGEDIAFMRAVDTLYAKHKTLKGAVFHLWHPTILGGEEQVRMWPGQIFPNENGPLAGKYHAAFGDREKMRQLVDGDGG